MKRGRISEIIGNIDGKYVDEAAGYTGKENGGNKNVRFKWGVIAACLILAVIVIPLAGNLLTIQSDKKTVDSILLIEYEKAYLEVIESNPQTLKKHGLETEVTEELIGKHIAYLKKETPDDERSNYVVSEEKTDLELFEYAPAPYKAVRIFRDGETYYYALFCNYLIKTSECLPVTDGFEVYGVTKSSDIVSITPVASGNSWKASGKAITDSGSIDAFYKEISTLSAYSFDDYHNAVFADELEELEGTDQDIDSEAYSDLAEDRKDIVIETKEGLRFAIWYYPSYGWINEPATMSYYRMTSDISEWFSKYVE